MHFIRERNNTHLPLQYGMTFADVALECFFPQGLSL